MKIILVVADKGKSIGFVSDKLLSLPLDEAIRLAGAGEIDGVGIVKRSTGFYLRTKPSVPKEQELDRMSVSSHIVRALPQGISHAISTPAISAYLKLYIASVGEGKPFIVPVGQPKVLTVVVKERLLTNRNHVFSASKHFEIDPHLLGAILVDEIARLKPFENLIDVLGLRAFGRDTSVGIAQVKITTANNLILNGLYNPNSKDKRLLSKHLDYSARLHLYEYLVQPKHSIYFAAAHIRALVDGWRRFVDLSQRPEIIATLYHRSYKAPHGDPHPNSRGQQIANEFYVFSKKWLG